MKISLALGPRRELSRQTAWGCLTANAALPGSGSLAAGRVCGYGQMALTLLGFLLTMGFGLPFMAWYVAHWQRLTGDQADPLDALGEMWIHVRWALLGIGIFILSWLWALMTSLAILHSAPRSTPGAPPRLH